MPARRSVRRSLLQVTVELRALLDLFYDEAAEHLTDLETVLLSLDPVAPIRADWS